MSEPDPILTVPADLHDAMVAHCRREAPREACGFLGGMPPLVSSIHPLRNIAETGEIRYLADPLDQIEAERALRARKARVLAIYHSHPKWQAVPSKADLQENYCGELPRIIVSLLGEEPEVRVWRLHPESYEELPWRIVPAAGG